jgi:hypothetical protein
LVNALAAKYDASVEEETDDEATAYADWRLEPWHPAANAWRLE